VSLADSSAHPGRLCKRRSRSGTPRRRWGSWWGWRRGPTRNTWAECYKTFYGRNLRIFV